VPRFSDAAQAKPSRPRRAAICAAQENARTKNAQSSRWSTSVLQEANEREKILVASTLERIVDFLKH
jgi:hypothetical protein